MSAPLISVYSELSVQATEIGGLPTDMLFYIQRNNVPDDGGYRARRMTPRRCRWFYLRFSRTLHLNTPVLDSFAKWERTRRFDILEVLDIVC